MAGTLEHETPACKPTNLKGTINQYSEVYKTLYFVIDNIS